MQHMYQSVKPLPSLYSGWDFSRFPGQADFHLVQIDEMMAGMNGDANVQFSTKLRCRLKGKTVKALAITIRLGHSRPLGDNVGPGASWSSSTPLGFRSTSSFFQGIHQTSRLDGPFSSLPRASLIWTPHAA